MFDLGSIYPAAVDVTNAAGVLTDPATAVLTITLPDGTTTSPAVTLPSAVPGQLRYSYQTIQPGRHLARWQTTTPNLGYTDAFDVAEAAPPMIIGLSMAKKALQIDPADTADDEDLREMLMGITLAIEDYKNETIARQVVTGESHPMDLWASWMAPRLTLLNTPVISLTSLVSQDGTKTWNVPDLYVDKATGIVSVIRGPAITGWTMAAYVAGYQIIPYRYLQGAKVMLQWLWESRRGPGGLGGVIGPEELHAMASAHPYLIPRKAQDWLGPPQPVVA